MKTLLASRLYAIRQQKTSVLRRSEDYGDKYQSPSILARIVSSVLDNDDQQHQLAVTIVNSQTKVHSMLLPPCQFQC